MLYKHMIQKNMLLNLNIIITVIERRIRTGPKPETETIWIEKKKSSSKQDKEVSV